MYQALQADFLPQTLLFPLVPHVHPFVYPQKPHRRTHSAHTCMQGEWGPFQPNRAVEVPVWMALALHRRKKARILPPAWMDADALKGGPAPSLPWKQHAGSAGLYSDWQTSGAEGQVHVDGWTHQYASTCICIPCWGRRHNAMTILRVHNSKGPDDK